MKNEESQNHSYQIVKQKAKRCYYKVQTFFEA